uniref:Cyclin-dependent kinase 2-interacting protein-like n=1 Tax=Phallusia mammillata TaxID=59560 RepID=A0A6F9DA05_9ASCI|nr:cyclin-dependent kinase 2-interacting protein-like [Phallusia mammillata]
MKQKRKSFSSGQGQLTGLPRQLKDNVADVHNFVAKWNKLNSKGFTQLTNVCDIKISLLSNNETNSFAPQYSSSLEEACDLLCETYKELEKVCTKLTNVSLKFAKLTKLDGAERPFVSWGATDFASRSQEICEMLQKELKVKKCIVENVAHVDHHVNVKDVNEFNKQCRDYLMFYSSCWLHQPYINEGKLGMLIHEMLMESGHA